MPANWIFFNTSAHSLTYKTESILWHIFESWPVVSNSSSRPASSTKQWFSSSISFTGPWTCRSRRLHIQVLQCFDNNLFSSLSSSCSDSDDSSLYNFSYHYLIFLIIHYTRLLLYSFSNHHFRQQFSSYFLHHFPTQYRHQHFIIIIMTSSSSSSLS